DEARLRRVERGEQADDRIERILLARGELAVLARVCLHVDLVRDPEVGRELLVGAVERRVRDVVPVEDAGGAAVDDPGGAVGMARLEDADAVERGGSERGCCGHMASGLFFRAGPAGPAMDQWWTCHFERSEKSWSRSPGTRSLTAVGMTNGSAVGMTKGTALGVKNVCV